MEKLKKFYDMQKKYLFLVMCLPFMVTLSMSPVLAAGKETTKIKHKPIKHFMVEKRIQVQAAVKDKKGIELVRCYFKSKESADFVFVPMTHKDKNTFEGILPAPSKATHSIDYLFLSVNKNNIIVKTQIFTATRDENSKFSGEDANKGDIKVFTEIESAPTPQGFSDSIVMNVTESSTRFGIVVGGLYGQTAGVSGVAASATSAGAVTAGAGLSTTAIVAGGVALAAGAGAVASGGSGGGGGSDPENATIFEDATIAGNWSGTLANINDSSDSGPWQMEIAEDNSFYATGFVNFSSEEIYGTWNVDGTKIKGTFFLKSDGSSVGEASADVTGDSISGELNTNDGKIITWSGNRSSIYIAW